MNIYLHDIPLSEAINRIQTTLRKIGLWDVLGSEEIQLDEHALGRILFEPIWAKISSPHYHASAMDGFAVRSSDTDGAFQTKPIILTYGSKVQYVDTGDPLPLWANAVIMIENVEPLDKSGKPAENPREPDSIRIRAAVPPWFHVRPMGEDMVATQLVLPSGHKIRAVDLGAIAGSGHSSVIVARKPRVVIIPTGSELKPIGEPVGSGDIIEYNSVVLAAQIKSWGGDAVRLPIVPDRFKEIQSQVVDAALKADLILINAGSSAGSEDYSAMIVESLGSLIFHGVAVRPGHPVIFGIVEPIEKDKVFGILIHNAIEKTQKSTKPAKVPIIGVPGYPVSAALTGEIFVEMLIARWLGTHREEPVEMEATLTRKLTSPSGDDDFVRMAVGKVGNKVLAAPLSRGSGVISSLVRADGIAIVPRGSQGLPAGEEVNVRLYRSIKEIERTIFAVGSHDIALDVLAHFLSSADRRLASTNVGSLGGLVALQRGESHLAGAHLLDPESGEFNLSYIQKYLKGLPVKVVSLVMRSQGLMVLKYNPLEIKSLGDLARDDVSFVNRQRGSGTRILLDYHLHIEGVEPGDINGYGHEEYTHLGVAAAISSGRYDSGLGIAAAAESLELDFIPLFQERYDLVIPIEFAESDLLDPLFQVLQDGKFKKIISNLSGYDISVMGNIIAELN